MIHRPRSANSKIPAGMAPVSDPGRRHEELRCRVQGAACQVFGIALELRAIMIDQNFEIRAGLRGKTSHLAPEIVTADGRFIVGHDHAEQRVAIGKRLTDDRLRLGLWQSHHPLDHHPLDLGNRFRRVQPLRAGLGAVHDRVATIELERVFQIIQPRPRCLIA